MIRTYIGLPPTSSPLLPSPPSSYLPPPPPQFPLMPRGCIAKASLMFTNASQKYRRYITDHLSEQSAIVTECSADIRLYRRCFGEHSPYHRRSNIFHRNCWYLSSKSQDIGKHRVYNYTFTIADAKIPNGTEALPTYHCHVTNITLSHCFVGIS